MRAERCMFFAKQLTNTLRGYIMYFVRCMVYREGRRKSGRKQVLCTMCKAYIAYAGAKKALLNRLKRIEGQVRGLPHAGYFKPYCIRGQPGDRGVHGRKLSRPRKSEAFSCTVSARTGGTVLLRFSLGFAHGKLGRKSLFGHQRRMCAVAARR